MTQDVLSQYRVTCSGAVINLPYCVGDAVYHVKYKDTSKPAKESWRSSANSTPILFGWQAIPDGCRELVITEGEWDAMAYAVQIWPNYALASNAMATGTVN